MGVGRRLTEKKIVIRLMVVNYNMAAASILLLLLLWFDGAAAAAASSMEEASSPSQALPGCEADEWCGDFRIPYPFGTRPECYLNQNFTIHCNKTYDPPKPFLDKDGNLNITELFISGQLHVLQFTARRCFSQDGTINYLNRPTLTVPMFTISDTENQFNVIGCDTYAYIYGKLDGNNYTTGCMALCNSNSTLKDGSCSGSGCCQLGIPKGLRNLELEVRSFEKHTKVLDFNPCGYAFVIDKDEFQFSKSFIKNFPEEKVPLVLDWAISNDTCLNSEDKINCICGPKSKKIDMGSEYRCKCLDGYEGNPYLTHQGCRDIDECKDERSNDCIDKKWGCVNTPGSYTCNCPKNYEGDGKSTGKGCTRNSRSYIQIIIGIGVGLTVLLIGSSWSFLGYKKWRFIKLKQKFFKKNGGLILQQHLFRRQGPTDMVRIFTHEELKKATSNFDDSTVAGKGGYGTVYKGVLEDGLTVAIKKSKLIDQSQTDQFINEVIVLSQINHRNVVRLLGCCLETEVPLLVYEFIPNGTLFDHIHNKTKAISLTWEVRLRIAKETASVLSYLHSSASTPIIHRDIKSTNILLDHTYTAKVSDFGASKLVPLDQTQLSTMVQGTLGYLDPEYLLTSELTEKSDVYSFGIVLLELLTGKKAVSFEGPEAERNLAMYVLCAMKEDHLEQVVDKGMVTEANFEQIKEAAKLAKKCLRIKGYERPSMKEVAMELEGLKSMVEHPWVNNDVMKMEEMTYLLHETSESSQFVANDSMTATQIISQLPDGR